MAKPIVKIGLRKNPCFGSNKNEHRIPKEVIHVQASFSNTIMTVTDVRGRVVSWATECTSGFEGTKKRAPYASQAASFNALRTLVDQGMQRVEVMIKGPGLGRDAALRAIRRNGMLLSFIHDVTPMQHNGSRPLKKDVCRNKNSRYSKRNK